MAKQLAKLQMVRSPRLERVQCPDFGGESIEDQSFGFGYLLCDHFDAKNFEWMFSRAQKDFQRSLV